MIPASLLVLIAASLPPVDIAAGGESPNSEVGRLIDTALHATTIDVSLENRPALSPDGKRLAIVVTTPMMRPRPPIPRFPFRTRRPKDLLLLEISTGAIKQVSPPQASGWQPVWTREGEALLFYSDTGDGVTLWAYRSDAKGSHRVSEARIAEGFLATTPAQIGRLGREAFVSLEPPRPPQPTRDEPNVAVYRSGREDQGKPSATTTRRVDAGFARSFAAELAAIELATGLVRTIVPANADPPPQRLNLSASGRWLSYTSPPRHSAWLSSGKPPSIATPDITTDLAVVPTSGGTPTLLETDIGLDAAVWHPTEDLIGYVKGGELGILNASADGRWTRRQLGSDLAPFADTPLAFSPDGRSLLVSRSSESENARTETVLVPLDGGVARRGMVDPQLSLVDVALDARGVLWALENGSAAALFRDNHSGESAVWRLDLASGNGSESWRGAGTLVFAETSKNPNGVIVSFEDSLNPADLFWLSPDLSQRRRLTHVSRELDDAVDDLAGTIEYFTTEVPAFDGALQSVRTAVIMPRGAPRDGTGRGIVCIYPGADFSTSAALFGAGDKCGIPSYVLGAKGFTIVLPHLLKRPRGTTGNVAQEYADALLPIVYRAASLGYVDVKKVALFGHSQGAYAATSIISETNVFRAAVAASSLTYDLVGGFGYMRPGFSVPNLVPMISHQMSAPPWQDLKRYIANSPYLQADRITTPLLLLVGTADRFPHVEEAGKLFNALSTYDKTVQLAVYEGEDHLLFRGSLTNNFDLWNRMLEFLDRHMP